jgi:hypothetical protein
MATVFAAFIFGAVVSAVINIVTALLNRDRGLQLLPLMLFYILCHGTYVLADTFGKGWLIVMARRSDVWTSYVIVMVIAAVLAGLYWKTVRAAAAALDRSTSHSVATYARPTAKEAATELARHLPKPEMIGATDRVAAAVVKANTYPDIETTITESNAELFLLNQTSAPVRVSVRVISRANKFDQKSLSSRQMPPSTVDLGQIAVGDRKRLIKIELIDEIEEAVVVTADFSRSPDFTHPVVYRVYFRKPAQAWQFEYTLHDSYERRKLLQKGGVAEDTADRRRRIRFKLSQLIMHGNMLKEGFMWLCIPSVDEKPRLPIDPTEKLGTVMMEIQAWRTEVVFWTEWELGGTYSARLTTPTQSALYPRGFEQLPHADFYRDSWDQLTACLTKLEEFLRELPEL